MRRWAGANDTDIARQASEALAHSVDVPADAVKVVVHDHGITLSGSTPWQFQRRAAERAVRYLKGVTSVHNGITIRPVASATGIKTAITAAFVRDAQLEGRNITVTADGGQVTLRGKVHSVAERRRANTAAWSAPGVTGVTSQLTVDG